MSTAGAFICINCGAALTIAPLANGELPATAACGFCNVINDRAQLELLQDRADARHAELVRSGRQRFLLQVLGVVAGGVVLLGGIAYTRASAALATAWAEVDRADAQRRNVHERQLAVQVQWANAQPSPERDAELSGAENRTRLERKRYDDAVAAYNTEVGTWFARLAAKLRGLPTRAEPSTEAW